MLVAAAGTAIPAATRQQEPDEVTEADLKALEKIAGLEFSDEEREAVLRSVRQARGGYESLRELSIDYTVEPPTAFLPSSGMSNGKAEVAVRPTPLNGFRRPPGDEQLAFLSVRELGHLVKTKQISSVELTRTYLDRLKRYGEKLLCVVTLTEELAMKQAERADREIASGRYRGPLHGIPYGIKDLFAVTGYPTTWGSEPHKEQQFDYDAAVVERLEEAGAILVAKLSMGALAQGDVWFNGRTKNPWNPEQGSSGSSAGSSAATAAGLVAFSIGTETLGSIVSPSHRCRVTGLRPTYGRVSRYGAMAVSWTMDKIGPICREAEDCALVFAAIAGADRRDKSSVDRPFQWRPHDNLAKMKIGYLIAPDADPNDRSPLQEQEHLKLLAELGANLYPIQFERTYPGVSVILGVEAAAAFDAFTRSDAIDKLKNSAWPRTYRSNRYIPAVEYLRAQRARTLMMRSFEKRLEGFDLVVTQDRGSYTLFITNLTGHPQVLVPNGVNERGSGRSISFVGPLYKEDVILNAARVYQNATGHHKKHPDLSGL
ncbi:MAG: amidase [Armatimonadetes bacterium]|nr:amidase [Armatimonadota bacterium]